MQNFEIESLQWQIVQIFLILTCEQARWKEITHKSSNSRKKYTLEKNSK